MGLRDLLGWYREISTEQFHRLQRASDALGMPDNFNRRAIVPYVNEVFKIIDMGHDPKVVGKYKSHAEMYAAKLKKRINWETKKLEDL